MTRFKLVDALQDAVRGALCCECKLPLGNSQQLYYSYDTTKRTVHWNCRTKEDIGTEN